MADRRFQRDDGLVVNKDGIHVLALGLLQPVLGIGDFEGVAAAKAVTVLGQPELLLAASMLDFWTPMAS